MDTLIQPEMLKMKEVADLLSVSVPTARKTVQDNQIPFYLFSGVKRYRRRDIIAFLDTLQGETEVTA